MKNKILVIDDDEMVRDVVRHVLESEGFEVIEGVNSNEAISKAKKYLPELIVLDLGIAEVGGMEVCRILRHEKDTLHIPIIILTGRINEKDKLTGLDTGADDYITKPFQIGEFAARVKAVLRRLEYRKKNS